MLAIKVKSLFFACSLLAIAAMATTDEKRLEHLLHKGNNIFTAKMFSEVAKANARESFVLSAYSVLTPLAQLALASVEDAHAELLHAIGMPDGNTIKAVFSLARRKQESIEGITLKAASKIYVAERYELNSNFADDTRDAFDSEVQNINFAKCVEAANEINTWVEAQTNNRIKNLVDSRMLTRETRAVLVNAIYFKGTWKKKFRKELTSDSTFNINKTKSTTVPMMFRKGQYRYSKSPDLKSQIIELPYEGDESSLVIVLPLDIEGITVVQEILKDPNVLEKALKRLYESKVKLYLPQFKIETTTDLKDILMNMNIHKMFDPLTAKLTNLIKRLDDLYVAAAAQKAFIEVNEEGAEAAAANAIILQATSLNSEPPSVVFRADHPFLFFLRVGENTMFNGAYYS